MQCQDGFHHHTGENQGVPPPPRVLRPAVPVWSQRTAASQTGAAAKLLPPICIWALITDYWVRSGATRKSNQHSLTFLRLLQFPNKLTALFQFLPTLPSPRCQYSNPIIRVRKLVLKQRCSQNPEVSKQPRWGCSVMLPCHSQGSLHQATLPPT